MIIVDWDFFTWLYLFHFSFILRHSHSVSMIFIITETAAATLSLSLQQWLFNFLLIPLTFPKHTKQLQSDKIITGLELSYFQSGKVEPAFTLPLPWLRIRHTPCVCMWIIDVNAFFQILLHYLLTLLKLLLWYLLKHLWGHTANAATKSFPSRIKKTEI